MAIISLRNSSLFSMAKGFSFSKPVGAMPVVPTPVFVGTTTSSYTASITGYDPQLTYTISATAGIPVRTDETVVVSGLSANQSSILTVTAANSDASKGLSFTANATFFSLPNTPTLVQATENPTGGTVTITNYDASATYLISVSAGSSSRTGNTITFTGLTRGQSATLTVTASNPSGSSGTAILTVFAEEIGEYDSIATITVPSGGLSSVTFSNIPQNYQHLQIRGIVRNESVNGNDLYLQFNGNTASSYTLHQLNGNGTTAAASGSTGISGASMAQTANTASTFGAFIIDILDYTSTTKNPVFRCFGGYDVNGLGLVSIRSSMYNGTSAITSIRLFQGGSVNQAQHSTFALYGVKAP